MLLKKIKKIYLFNNSILLNLIVMFFLFFFFQAEDGIRDGTVTGVQTVLFRSVTPARRTQTNTDGGTSSVFVHGCPCPSRSEERRVGKECRSRWSPDH